MFYDDIGIEKELATYELKTPREKVENFHTNIASIRGRKLRTWLRLRGKEGNLDFTDDELRKLKECFASLDEEKSGSIGLKELEEPLIGLGFAQTKQDV